ncbi:SPT3 Dosage dependent suppressor of Ty-induced promoter mutations-like protein [Mortierella sp. AD032]|nr:SPT3 Dosage dependent suppressor of Ty-induced promoter mutations-like protein [Mortierella sp. AD032]
MVGYSLEARIIQKKDQLEELSATGAIIPAPMVEEVRTGQQFLIKVHLTKNNSTTLPLRFPALRVGRREAINTAGEARSSEPEPLTLEIAVHLAKSGQTRNGACAKCCHKYGPLSPILVLLDPLSPSVTDPASYAHVDTTSGSITMLAKVLCSSTDHGERGNKDRYIFEFRLKSTSSMPLIASTSVAASSANTTSPRASEAPEDEGDTVSSCFTQPIMCSGHHKAKRVYPHQRPIKTSKGIPTPKIKTIKRHKSVPTITMPGHHGGAGHHSVGGETSSSSSDYLQDNITGPMSSTGNGHHSGLSSAMSFLSDPLSQLSEYSQHPHHPHQPHQGEQQQQQQHHHHHHHHHHDLNASRSHSLDNQGQPFLLTLNNASNNNNSNTPTSAISSTNPITTTINHGLSDPLQQQPHPRIIEVRPNHGPIRKTTDVVLRGLAFREGMVPYFGCFPAQDIIVETASLMVCKAPESPLPGTVAIAIYDRLGNSFSDLGQFTYTDDSETELLILQLQLRLAHRALEYMHTRATGQKGNAQDILREIPGLATSPRSGSLLMMDSPEEIREAVMTMAADDGEEVDDDMPLMTLMQIEQSILNTLDNIPRGMDISVQLDDGTNLLHLAILLGLNYLAARLVEEGCDLEAQDAWSMTPLMYAVLKGNEAIARILIIAGASSSGSSTPDEFYTRLPWSVEPTQSMYNFLSVSCTRFSGSPRLYTLDASSPMDSEMAAVDEDEEGEWIETSSDSSVEYAPTSAVSIAVAVPRSVSSIVSVKLEPSPDTTIVTTSTSTPATSISTRPYDSDIKQDLKQEEEEERIPDLATAIQSVRATPLTPPLPLDQQDLPPLHTVEQDGSVTINPPKVVQGGLAGTGTDAYGGHGAELFRNVNPESGYHTGVYSEVEEQLNRMHLATLPSTGVVMSVSLKRLPPSGATTRQGGQQQEVTVMRMGDMPPLELYRTGDSFGVEIQLRSTDDHIPMPKECLGLRFPHEMIKRVNGKPANILNEMTYTLRASIELGKSSLLIPTSSSSTAEQEQESVSMEREHEHGDGEEEEHYGDGIPLIGSCPACSKYLHEQKKLSPSRRSQIDPSVYPVLQFSIPGGSSSGSANPMSATVGQSASSAGVVQMREGVCEVKAKVNCSSLHHLKARHAADALKRRQQQQQQQQQLQDVVPSITTTAPLASAPVSDSSRAPTVIKKSSTSSSLSSSTTAKADLQDPGFVFKFELVHPVTGEVVARSETAPILFQTFSRGRN